MLSDIGRTLLYFLSLTPFIVVIFCIAITVLPKKNSSRFLALPLALCFGPILLSGFLELLLTYAPQNSDPFYLKIVLVTGSVLALFCLYLRRTNVFMDLYRWKLFLNNFSGFERASLIILLLGVMLAVFSSFILPLRENDPLEYASTARQLYLLKDATLYPFTDTSISGGYYGPWSHGLGYINLWAWAGIINDNASLTAGTRLISVYYMTVIALSMFCFNWRKNRLANLLAAIMFVGTPIVYVNAISSHIDMIRIATLYLTISVFYVYLGSKKESLILLCALCSGASLYTHSLNLLLLPLIALLWLLHEKRISVSMVQHGIVFLVVSFLIVFPRYWVNVKIFGAPIADFSAVPVWQLESLHFQEWFRLGRNLNLLFDRVVYGIGKGISQPDRFGLSYYFFMLAFYCFFLEVLKRTSGRLRALFSINNWQQFCFHLTFVFMMFVIVSVILGSDSFIKNERYTLTIQPFILIFTFSILVKRLGVK